MHGLEVAVPLAQICNEDLWAIFFLGWAIVGLSLLDIVWNEEALALWGGLVVLVALVLILAGVGAKCEQRAAGPQSAATRSRQARSNSGSDSIRGFANAWY